MCVLCRSIRQLAILKEYININCKNFIPSLPVTIFFQDFQQHSKILFFLYRRFRERNLFLELQNENIYIYFSRTLNDCSAVFEKGAEGRLKFYNKQPSERSISRGDGVQIKGPQTSRLYGTEGLKGSPHLGFICGEI